MLCHRCPERPPSQDDDVKGPGVRSNGLIGGTHHFLPGIACIPAEDIETEGCPFCLERHCILRFGNSSSPPILPGRFPLIVCALAWLGSKHPDTAGFLALWVRQI